MKDNPYYDILKYIDSPVSSHETFTITDVFEKFTTKQLLDAMNDGDIEQYLRSKKLIKIKNKLS
jgi:hypothetical protein